MGLAFGIITFIVCGIYVLAMFISKPYLDKAYEEYNKKKGFNLQLQWTLEEGILKAYPYLSSKEREAKVVNLMEYIGYTYEWHGGCEACPNDAKHNPMKDPEYLQLNSLSKFLGH